MVPLVLYQCVSVARELFDRLGNQLASDDLTLFDPSNFAG